MAFSPKIVEKKNVKIRFRLFKDEKKKFFFASSLICCGFQAWSKLQFTYILSREHVKIILMKKLQIRLKYNKFQKKSNE